MLYRFLLKLIFIFSFFLISCDKKVDEPSYLLIDKFDYKVDSVNLEIKDVWVYIDNDFKGAYPLPAKVPIFNEGENKVEVKPGVILYNQKGIRVQHPFLMAKDTILNFNSNEVSISPKLSYKNNALFIVKEDFESDNNFLKLIFNSKDSFPNYRFSNNQSFGDFCGRFLTDNTKRSKVTLVDSIYFKTNENWFIEVDYLNKGAIEFGVEVFKNGIWDDYPILLNMPAVSTWQKTYFNPMPYLKDAMTEGYFRFYVMIYVNEQEREIFLDNIHIIKQVD
jgi:hypothetical protein